MFTLIRYSALFGLPNQLYLMEEGESRIKATYRDNYERLQQIKAKYDPDNFFHVNQNIKP